MSASTFQNDQSMRLVRSRQFVVTPRQFETLRIELKRSRAREESLLNTLYEEAALQQVLAQEFEHRIINGLQLVSSLLSVQARNLRSPEAASQLTTASRRVASLGRVHHRLHQFDRKDRVEFGSYLRHLCEDLSSLLFEGQADWSLEVKEVSADVPAKIAIPLGFIVNELVTNAAKYARGRIVARFEKATVGYSLSVEDDGPGLQSGFDPSRSKGLGMRIVLALVKQIGGDLRISPVDIGGGTRFMVRFDAASV